MGDSRDDRIFTDENNEQWLTDENGKLLTDERGNKIRPTISRVVSKEGDFTVYDSTKGHCALCGSRYCSGRCFK